MYTPSATVLAANLRACGITSARQMEEITTELLCRMPKGGTCTPASGGGGTAQDMQVSWEPTALKFGEMIGFTTNSDLPLITKLVFRGVTSSGGFNFIGMSSLTEMDFPNLASIDPSNTQGGSINVAGCLALASVTFPHLVTVGGTFDVDTCPLISSLSLANLVTVGGNIMCLANTTLSDVSVPSLIPSDFTTIRFDDCALNHTSVELILRRCVMAGVTACTIKLNGGTNAGLLSLSVQGQADAATLGGQLTINP